MTSNNNSTDDGSLSFLNIQPDEANKHFNCPETTQQKLINVVCPSGVLFGGNANNSANAGLSYANTNNTATNTNANIGSQLY